MSHTPGPWIYGKSSESIITDRGKPICDFDFAMGIVPADEVMANARLIVAAPRLLELARSMIRIGAHERNCRVAEHERFAREAKIGSVRRGRGASTDSAAIARARREFAEHEAKRPACTCVLAEATHLLDEVEGRP